MFKKELRPYQERLALHPIYSAIRSVETFISEVTLTSALGKALNQARVPAYVKTLVKYTIKTARNASTAEVASSFLFGREDSISKMFQTLMTRWGLTAQQAPQLTYYLTRHIEVDSGDHGPGAQKMLSRSIVTPQLREKALRAAIDAIEHRIRLWNGIYREIKKSDAGA